MKKKLLVVLIVVIVAVIGASVILASPQPNIQATNVQVAKALTFCVFPEKTPVTWQIAFTLVNTGSAGGFADVVIVADGKQTNAKNKYYVEARSQSKEQLLVQMPDCFDEHQFEVKIVSQSK